MSQKLLELFADPPSIYRTMPQWSWNGELKKERITRVMEQFAANGIGGLFAHARPGCITEYLSEDYMDAWGHAMREGKRLGVGFHIYDEFCCPAGNAVGMVVNQKPYLARQELAMQVSTGQGSTAAGEVLGVFRSDDAGALVRAPYQAMQEATCAAPAYILRLRTTSGKSSFGGMADADLLRRETTDTFIDITYERYARYQADFGEGQAVRFLFTDEPHLSGSGSGLPMSRDLMLEFYKDHGYAIEERLDALCFGGADSAAVRFDYFWTVNRLFVDNCVRPMHDWCATHNLMLTGHFMEHEWPSPLSHPDAMHAMRWMQAPGNDLLGFQFYPTTPQENGIYLLNVKELSSVANQLARRWVMVESCGGGNYESSFNLFKPLEDYLLAGGVNVMDPHLSHYSIAGGRKYDWPHTLSDHSPWWQYYRAHADHVARVNAVLSQGKEYNRVLVLHPTTTAWCYYEHPAYHVQGRAPSKVLDEIRDSQVSLVLALLGNQVDFDLGDEFILQELARIEAKRLKLGTQAYETIVIPQGMENLCSGTLDLLERFVAAGGRVISLREPPTLVDGRPSTRARTVVVSRVDSNNELVRALRKLHAPYISTPTGEALPSGLAWRRSVMADGTIAWFFCNPWKSPLAAQTRLPGEHFVQLDSRNAKAHTLDSRKVEGGAVIALSLPPHGHALWLSTPTPVQHVTPIAKCDRPIALELTGCSRVAENILVVDYCDLQVGSRQRHELYTTAADTQNWKWNGFDGSPWRGAQQLRRTIIDRALPKGANCTITYRFNVAEGLSQAALQSLHVAIERPWLYHITLNGSAVSFDSADRWLDDEIRRAAIGSLVRAGENTLTLVADPMTILVEIMPVYVLGEFALAPADRGFVIESARPIAAGDWTQQGLPFYHDAVSYRFAVEIDKPACALELTLPQWRGSVAVAMLDGKECGCTYDVHTPIVRTGAISQGRHELEVRIIGSMHNLMGPHHTRGLAGAWTWEASPSPQPSGLKYMLRPTGLDALPLLKVV